MTFARIMTFEEYQSKAIVIAKDALKKVSKWDGRVCTDHVRIFFDHGESVERTADAIVDDTIYWQKLW